MGPVELPRWAHTPEEFIRVHREALVRKEEGREGWGEGGGCLTRDIIYYVAITGVLWSNCLMSGQSHLVVGDWLSISLVVGDWLSEQEMGIYSSTTAQQSAHNSHEHMSNISPPPPSLPVNICPLSPPVNIPPPPSPPVPPPPVNICPPRSVTMCLVSYITGSISSLATNRLALRQRKPPTSSAITPMKVIT